MRPARRRVVPVRPAGRSGLRGGGFLARRIGCAGSVEHLGCALRQGPCPVHPPMAAPRAAGQIASTVAARLARSPVKAHEPPAAIMSTHELPCGQPEPRPCDWVRVERATGPLRRATRPTPLVRPRRASRFESSSCRTSAAGCRRERPGWPFHSDSVASHWWNCFGVRPSSGAESRPLPRTLLRPRTAALRGRSGYLRSPRWAGSRFDAGIKPPFHL